MSVESLKKRKDVAWVEDYSPMKFGPPAYDEKTYHYMWASFKKGFSWGNDLLYLILFIGFLLTSSLMVQYQVFIYMLKPAIINPLGILINPIVYGSAIGSIFGLYQIYAR